MLPTVLTAPKLSGGRGGGGAGGGGGAAAAAATAAPIRKIAADAMAICVRRFERFSFGLTRSIKRGMYNALQFRS